MMSYECFACAFIVRALCKVVGDQPETWDDYLDVVMFGLRTKKANDHWSTHPITWFLAERLVIHMKSQNTTWSFCLWQTTGKSYAKHLSKFLMHMQNSFNACYITTLKATILSDPGSEATAKEENATRTSPQNQYALQVHKPNHKQQQTQIQKLQLHQWLLPRL